MAKEKKKGFIAEFKEFIAKGNVIDMAVGVVVGTAFKAIVSSLVDNIINPLIGLAINTASLADAKAILKEAVVETVDGVETVVMTDYNAVPVFADPAKMGHAFAGWTPALAPMGVEGATYTA